MSWVVYDMRMARLWCQMQIYNFGSFYAVYVGSTHSALNVEELVSTKIMAQLLRDENLGPASIFIPAQNNT